MSICTVTFVELVCVGLVFFIGYFVGASNAHKEYAIPTAPKEPRP